MTRFQGTECAICLIVDDLLIILYSSANPAALLSSRLSAYLKRPWSSTNPCPLDKELTTVHPRKVYFFLTTLPRQEIPTTSLDAFVAPHSGGKGGRRVISPSLSNASIDEDNESAEERKRTALSPSPEVELSTEDLNFAEPGAHEDFVTPPTPAGSAFSTRSSLARDGSAGSSSGNSLSHNHKAASPPLEGDEKEFTQTASNVRMRGMSLDNHIVRPTTENTNDMDVEETEEEKAKRNHEAAEALFGSLHPQEAHLGSLSSPLVKPMRYTTFNTEVKQEDEDVEMKEPISILGDNGAGLTWDTREPEDIRIEDLDDLFGAI